MTFAGLFAAPTQGLAPSALAGALEGLLGVGTGAGPLAGKGEAAAGGFAALLVAAMDDAGQPVQAAPSEAPASPLGRVLNTASPTVLAAAAAPAAEPAPPPQTNVIATSDADLAEAEMLAPGALALAPKTQSEPAESPLPAAGPVVLASLAPKPVSPAVKPAARPSAEAIEAPDAPSADLESAIAAEPQTEGPAARTKIAPHAHVENKVPEERRAAPAADTAPAPQVQVAAVQPPVAVAVAGEAPAAPAETAPSEPAVEIAGAAAVPPGLIVRASVLAEDSPARAAPGAPDVETLAAGAPRRAEPAVLHAANPAAPAAPAAPKAAPALAAGDATPQPEHPVFTAQPAPRPAAAPLPAAPETAPATAAPAPLEDPVQAVVVAAAPQAPVRAAPAAPQAGPEGLVSVRGELAPAQPAPVTASVQPARPDLPAQAVPPDAPQAAALAAPLDAPQAAPQSNPQAAPAEAPRGVAGLVLTQQLASEDASPLWKPLTKDEPASPPARKVTSTSAAVSAGQDPQMALAEDAAAAPVAPAARPGVESALEKPSSAPVDLALPDDLPAGERPTLKAEAAPAPPPALAAAPPPPASAPVATPQTVNTLAAQIAAQAAPGKTSRFTVQLDPVGLGKVDVRVEITAAGELTAALSFHEAHAAGEISAKASELQSALTQAGFDPSRTQLSFNTDTGASNPQLGQQMAQQQQQQQRDAAPLRPAFVNLTDLGDPAAPVPVRSARDGGVDVTV